MEIKILYLYGDIMNLYGEYANILALSRCLADNGHTASVTHFSLQDNFALNGFDFYFMGSGTEKNRNAVLKHLSVHQGELASAIENGAVMLFTGNSWELMGKKITTADGETMKGFGVFDFIVKEGKKRITGDALGRSDFFSSDVVGFINKCSEINGVDSPLFTLRLGIGNDNKTTAEGIHKNNFFGTHIIGPLLIKNPWVLNKMCKLLTHTDADFSTNEYSQKAYDISVEELNKRNSAT